MIPAAGLQNLKPIETLNRKIRLYGAEF